MRGRFVQSKGDIIIEVVSPLIWSGRTSAWQINAPAKLLSSDQSLQALHSLLLREEALGNIVRQEAVSMIPAMFLQVEGHHYVLDMCAAPGSKTEQLMGRLPLKSAGIQFVRIRF